MWPDVCQVKCVNPGSNLKVSTTTVWTHNTCIYKITKIVHAPWLAERRVCMRVCNHGCDIKMFCFPCANHASTNLKKILSWKTRQVYFIYPFPRRMKLEKSLETCWVHLFLLELTFQATNTRILESIFFAKQSTDYAYKLCVQDFATGKNFFFNPCSKQKSFAFFLGKVVL